MRFIGQFCFADSRDIAGDIPADILLIFANPGRDHRWDEDIHERGFTFRWVSLDAGEPIAATDIPAITTDWPLAPYYAAIHRTNDFPDLGPNGGNFDEVNSDWSGLGLWIATKIGGVPWWEQRDPGLPGRFLCSLESIQPALDIPYPYLNVPTPVGLQWSERYPADDLEWGDMGRLYLHLDGDRIWWEVQGS